MFPFSTLLPKTWVIAAINIHTGMNAVRMYRGPVPKGGDTNQAFQSCFGSGKPGHLQKKKTMSMIPFGNDPAKIKRYKAFWCREDVNRPLVGFSFIGSFPLGEFEACKGWSSSKYLTGDCF